MPGIMLAKLFKCLTVVMRPTTSKQGLRLSRLVSHQSIMISFIPFSVIYTNLLHLMVLQLVDAVMLQLTRARGRLTTPASMTLTELGTSGLMVLRTHYTHWGLSLCPRALHPLATLFLTLFFIYINYSSSTHYNPCFSEVRYFIVRGVLASRRGSVQQLEF